MNNTDSFIDSKYYELFIGKDSNNYYPKYWLSSRCVDAISYSSDFDIHSVNSGSVGAGNLYGSNTYARSTELAFRPVITLNSNVQIDTATSGDGSTSEQSYKIK